MTLSIAYLVLVLVFAFILNLVVSKICFNRKYKFPNVVPGWPIIGNALDIPYPAGMWAAAMTKKHGEMFTLNIGTKRLVYLNSSRVVTDLLEKRAAIYSSRPYRPMLSEIMSGGARMVMMGYTDKWRNQRKIMHSILNGVQAEKKFVPFQDLESKQLVYDLFQDPENFHKASQRFSNSVILSVVFGRRARKDDELLAFILGYTGTLGEYQFAPTKSPADVFTWLSCLPKPLQWWRPFGEKFFKTHVEMFQKEYDLLLSKMEKGTAKPCFAVDVLHGAAKKEFEISDIEKIYTWTSLVEAGSDTTRTAVLQTIAGAACYPSWAVKARALLDEVCGHKAERLPMLADRERLPYITAVVKETLRWRPFLQSGVPRVLTRDDEYEGYRFPAGTEFSWNAYSIALDEKEYKDAERFEPERFMNEDLNKPTKGHWSFGAGRRVCAGLNVGVNNIWIAAATVLYCFDIAEDPDHPIDQFNTLWEEPTKAPFKVKITPRSKAHIALIEREGAIAQAADY
ncbi:related to cytochrome P450 [Phialocephala subalpina]|uniref:Related to cytochrome P450 n=1 Tax=Phialocephala subalpina TaxID=576137 RepID=A0A1L7WVN2_9HELO|nr:related to cytochrome P450 [Phialocephala subalpina]